jgi:hypothetical protein
MKCITNILHTLYKWKVSQILIKFSLNGISYTEMKSIDNRIADNNYYTIIILLIENILFKFNILIFIP